MGRRGPLLLRHRTHEPEVSPWDHSAAIRGLGTTPNVAGLLKWVPLDRSVSMLGLVNIRVQF